MWKALLPAIVALLPAVSALAQKNKKQTTVFHVFDKDWKTTELENAWYLVCQDKLSDSSYQVRYYNYTGPLISVETFRDEQKTIPHGFFGFYDNLGKIDSCGYSYMGKKDRDWLYFNDSLLVVRSEKYDKGKLIEKKDEATLKAEREEQKKNAKAPLREGEKEASFKGGEKNWKGYVEKNIKFPSRAEKMRKGGLVRVRFMINTDGIPVNIWLDKSVEYSLDDEAMRLIKTAPRWEPAQQDGKNVNAWRIQPITFRSS